MKKKLAFVILAVAIAPIAFAQVKVGSGTDINTTTNVNTGVNTIDNANTSLSTSSDVKDSISNTALDKSQTESEKSVKCKSAEKDNNKDQIAANCGPAKMQHDFDVNDPNPEIHQNAASDTKVSQ